MNDVDKVQVFLSAQSSLEVLGFSVECRSGGFRVERWGDPDHRCVCSLSTIEELFAFTLGIQKSDRTDLRGTLMEIKNIRNGKHEDGAVGKVTAMWKLAENAIQRTGPFPPKT
jgi:hypothetical protein